MHFVLLLVLLIAATPFLVLRSPSYMFGKGVYFADSSSKSANYVFASASNNVGFMLLCEVALGSMNELTHAEYMDAPPKGCLSTKGLGQSVPDESEYAELEEGLVVPAGKLKRDDSGGQRSLLYNEYIVYSVDQIRQRFLLKVQFNFKRGGLW